ncbi:MAG TPA: GNAT family N-acetyltransferase [Candidatus Baltobacteraceae bacterium]|nr:GNAT family N-acetyltransferase [Candidatus Baltobacteraceae bacterium]
MDIEPLSPDTATELERLSACFDAAIRPDAVERFFSSGTHHMLLAYEHGKPIGFISGVETTHPDKGTEMFVYELAVDERFRRRGCGSALVLALARLARERGCYAMWVLADQDNAAAIATYERAGGRRESTPVMLSWDFSGRD